jgi:hypothetical protein
MTIKTAKIALSLVWVIGAIPLLLILILRQLVGFYDPDPKAAWTWAAQFLFPNLTLIGGAWSVAASPGENGPISSSIVVWGAMVLSGFYLVVLYLILGVQALSTRPWQTIFEQSALFLGLLNALVVGWLGKFFVQSKH